LHRLSRLSRLQRSALRMALAGIALAVPGSALAAITVTRTGDFDFGRFVVTSGGATVSILANGGRSASGAVLISGGTVSRATFTIAGGPASATCGVSATGGPLGWLTVVLPDTVTLDPQGAATLIVGGTLSIGASIPAPGTYSASVTVTVTCP